MKGFVISLVLAVLMVTVIVLNVLYINNVEKNMKFLLDRLPSPIDADCSDAVRALNDYWQKNVRFVVLSVNFSTADRVSEQVATLVAAASCKDCFGYHTAIALARDAVGDMTRMERFSAMV